MWLSHSAASNSVNVQPKEWPFLSNIASFQSETLASIHATSYKHPYPITQTLYSKMALAVRSTVLLFAVLAALAVLTVSPGLARS
jgi:hypothetical protein